MLRQCPISHSLGVNLSKIIQLGIDLSPAGRSYVPRCIDAGAICSASATERGPP